MSEKVSVIIPVYNRIEELKRAIKSVLNQTFNDFELIIIDDGSTCNVKEVIDSFDDERIRFFRNENNRGVSFSRNRGIMLSKTNLIAFLDSDDEWLPKKLEYQVEYLKVHPEINLVHTEEIWIKNGKRINQGKRHKKNVEDLFYRSLELCLISPSTVMLRKSIFEKYGYFDENLLVCEDYDLWLRITAFEKVGFIERPLIYKYGGHNDQLSKKYEAMDKYRVISLMNLVKNNSLSEEQINKVKDVALRKLSILIKGAEKRNKSADLNLYKNWLIFFENF